jgi:predicted nuclease of predicted toxin-antitoxin system
VYGSNIEGKKWEAAENRFALSQGRRHRHAKGRNATDIEMVISAMDIMISASVDGFCLVSSDSDFTSLAIRLREAGKIVYGFGNEKAPQNLRHACSKFHVIAKKPKQSVPPPASRQPLPLKHAIGLLTTAFEACAVNGWVSLSYATKHIKAGHPDFAPKNYGVAGLKKLVAKCGGFALDRLKNQDVFRPAKAVQTLTLVKT